MIFFLKLMEHIEINIKIYILFYHSASLTTLVMKNRLRREDGRILKAFKVRKLR